MAQLFFKMDMSITTGIKKVFLAPIAGQSASIMAQLFIKMDMLSATGIKRVFHAPIAGQSTSIMALLFIRMDMLSATRIKKVFLAPIADQSVNSIKQKDHIIEYTNNSHLILPHPPPPLDPQCFFWHPEKKNIFSVCRKFIAAPKILKEKEFI